MNKELFMVFLPGISWILFALGGTQISDKIKGWKGWRRFILPSIFTAFCFFGGVIWWRSILVGAITITAFSLGYGVKKTWWQRVLVGLSYATISTPIGISAWNLLTPVVFIALFYLSNTKVTSNMFVWKICEGFFGLLCGIQLGFILMQRGLIF